MTPHAELRRGWCPGALTPMQTGDGWLVRVKPRAGKFTVQQLASIATVAAKFGNGAIDLTNRGNLQIRGLHLDTIALAQDALRVAGLVDDDAGVETRRNVLVTPIGCLTSFAGEIDALAARLEETLAGDAGLTDLPGKFGFSIEAAGRRTPAVSDADLTLVCDADGVDLAIAGDTTIAARASHADAIAAALSLARTYLEFRGEGTQRMRDAVGQHGADEIFAAARLATKPSPAVSSSTHPIGHIGHRGGHVCIGIGLPFGRIAAAGLQQLAAMASSNGIEFMRPSASRSMVFVCDAERAEHVVETAKMIGLIVDPADKRTSMDVCPGAPACERGTTNTRTDASHIACALSEANASLSVHLSGCVKGCARPRAADITIIGSDGSYSIVLDGTTNDTPVVSGITPEMLPVLLQDMIGARHA